MGAAASAPIALSATSLIALISVATFGSCGALANPLALLRDLFPANAVASIWGMASMGPGFGGVLFSQIAGVLFDRYSFKPVFVIFGAIPILAATLPREQQFATKSV